MLASRGGEPGRVAAPRFTDFLLWLATMAAVQFGDLAGSGRPASRSSPTSSAAGHLIEVIGMLQEKTAGNLSPTEAKLLDDLLYELRMRFVEAQKAAEAHHPRTVGRADHLSRHGHLARRADDRLRLRHVPLDRPARQPAPAVDLRRDADDAARSWSTPGRTFARRRSATTSGASTRSCSRTAHADHILGIDDVRRFNALMKRPMPCYGDARTLDDIRKTFHYVFDPASAEGRRPAVAASCRAIDGPFRIGDLDVQPIPLVARRRAPILGLPVRSLRLPDRLQPPRGRGLGAARRARRRSCSTRCASSRTRRTSRSARRSTRRGGSAPGGPSSRTCATICSTRPTNARLPAGMALAHDGLVLDCSH